MNVHAHTRGIYVAALNPFTGTATTAAKHATGTATNAAKHVTASDAPVPTARQENAGQQDTARQPPPRPAQPPQRTENPPQASGTSGTSGTAAAGLIEVKGEADMA